MNPFNIELQPFDYKSSSFEEDNIETTQRNFEFLTTVVASNLNEYESTMSSSIRFIVMIEKNHTSGFSNTILMMQAQHTHRKCLQEDFVCPKNYSCTLQETLKRSTNTFKHHMMQQVIKVLLHFKSACQSYDNQPMLMLQMLLMNIYKCPRNDT